MPDDSRRSDITSIIFSQHNPVSLITNLGAEIHEVGFEHILGFRRQIYIITDDFDKLLSFVVITHENTNFLNNYLVGHLFENVDV